MCEDSYETTERWVIALKKKIDNILLPRIRERRPDPRGYLPAAAEFLSTEKVMEGIAIEERVDGIIDRKLRRFFSLKAQKQLDRKARAKVAHSKAN
ncbi:hypothetical protein [Bradyrhizobium embrapense]